MKAVRRGGWGRKEVRPSMLQRFFSFISIMSFISFNTGHVPEFQCTGYESYPVHVSLTF